MANTPKKEDSASEREEFLQKKHDLDSMIDSLSDKEVR